MLSLSKIRTNGIDLAVHQQGDGPAVLLLHGFPGLAYSWRHQIPALVSAGYRVIVPDLRGYGHSDAPEPVEAYDIIELTNDLSGLLDALGLERAVVAGHDWGGILAWQIALFHPDRVAGVIAVSTPFIPHWMLWLHPILVDAALPGKRNFTPDPTIDPIQQMRQVYSADQYVLVFHDGHAVDEVMNADKRASLRASYRRDLVTNDRWDALPREVSNHEYYGKPVPIDLPGNDVLTAIELDIYTEAYRHHGFTPPINWYRNLSRNWRIGRDMDQTIQAPSLMISGEHDVLLRPSLTEGMQAHVPDLECHMIADSWHLTLEDQPAAVNDLVVDWLQRRFPVQKRGTLE